MSTPPRQSSIKTRPGSARRRALAAHEPLRLGMSDTRFFEAGSQQVGPLDNRLGHGAGDVHGSRLDARLTMPPERWPSHAVTGTARPLGVTSP